MAIVATGRVAGLSLQSDRRFPSSRVAVVFDIETIAIGEERA
jgi:hypothetical protein